MVALCCRKKQELQILYVDSKIPIKNYLFIINILYMMYGRETGIRTLGTFAGTTDFESAPFDHSGTSPRSAVGEIYFLNN